MRDPYLYEDVPVLRNNFVILQPDYGKYIRFERGTQERQSHFAVNMRMKWDFQSTESYLRKTVDMLELHQWHIMHTSQMAAIFPRKSIWKESCMMHWAK